jgi:hypothetical protein
MRRFAPPPAAVLACAAIAWAAFPVGTRAQTTSPGVRVLGGGASAPAPVTSAGATAVPGSDASSRYVESCQQAVGRGVVRADCQQPLRGNEILRLRDEALRTNDPALLMLLGDIYQSDRIGVSDIGQAYRWYLMAAVRGDPRAMQRLSDLYRSGQGAPQDKVKALGYARLAQRLAEPGSANARRANETVKQLGGEMAAEERTLADRFARELEAQMRQGQTRAAAQRIPGAASAAPPESPPPLLLTPAPAAAPAAATPKLLQLPGLSAAQEAQPAPAMPPGVPLAPMPRHDVPSEPAAPPP